jgi:hypothetical protein
MQRCCLTCRVFVLWVSGQVEAGLGGVAGQQVTQQQEVLWRVLAGVIPTGESHTKVVLTLH